MINRLIPPLKETFYNLKQIIFVRAVPSPYHGSKNYQKKNYARRDKILGIIAVILLWEAFSRSGLVLMSAFPPPSAVIRELIEMFLNPNKRFLWHIAGTLKRVSMGFAMGTLMALVFGVMAGISDKFNNFVSVVADFLYTIPWILIFSTFLLLFGLEENMRFYYISFGTFFYAFYIIRIAVREVSSDVKDTLDASRIDGANLFQILFYIVFPMRATIFMESIRQGLIAAWQTTFVAELALVDRGLGFLNQQAIDRYLVERNFAIVFLVAILALLTLSVPQWLSRLAAKHWSMDDRQI